MTMPMSSVHPFRFGVVARTADSRDAWVAKARRIERLGYAALLVPDHFGEQLAPLSAMMAAAEATSSLRIGSLVFDVDYRHPAVLQKELATLDLLTGGRIEWGMGAGWHRTEYLQTGIPFDAPEVRIERLEEAIRVIKGLFARAPLTFSGKHYAIDGLSGGPSALQQPYPPLLIGGGGRRILSLAAHEADIVGLAPRFANGEAVASSVTAEAVAQSVAWVRESAGERFADLELNILLQHIAVTEDRDTAAETLTADWGLSADAILTSPHALLGDLDQIRSQVRERRDRYGISYLAVFERDLEAFAPVVQQLTGQ